MKLLTIFIYLITVSFGYTIEKPDIKNLILNKNPKIYEDVTFKDVSQKDVNIADYKGKLIILNFWATWCVPCKKEMPSLAKLSKLYPNITIYPINLEKPNNVKTKSFFDSLNIKNLNIYYDPEFKLVKSFNMRGVPTSILIDKKGKEFARIIGEVDFYDESFINFLKKYL